MSNELDVLKPGASKLLDGAAKKEAKRCTANLRSSTWNYGFHPDPNHGRGQLHDDATKKEMVRVGITIACTNIC